MKALIWGGWLIVIAALSGYFGYRLLGDTAALPQEVAPLLDKRLFLIGEATHGHHQIELACGSCHTDPFGGGEVLQKACVSCHGDELKLAHDSHPKSKFTDPRNADRLQQLDARSCVTCHVEHQLEQTRAMGVTLPQDFCFHCHADIASERPSHAGMGFDTCASAGCHNYHDNRALYEDYLHKFATQSPLLDARLLSAPAALEAKHPAWSKEPAVVADIDTAPHQSAAAMATATVEWLASAHAEAGVNCSSCHQKEGVWQSKPALAICSSCHAPEADTFVAGKHGMRLNPALETELSPMTPAMGRLPFHADAANRPLDCNSCHAPHTADRKQAAVQACLGCHDDEHSRAYLDSPHHALWQQELAGALAPGSGVSCASCHLPRETHALADGDRIVVNHNQNANLRPNEKMIRPVCQQCHGLGFAIDALADPALIRNNFSGKPAQHIESIDMVLERSSATPSIPP